MRVYNQPHGFYCGIDLHARSLFVHVLDHTGCTRLEQDIPASPQVFLDAVKPYRDGLVVGCECMFAWYWLADLCERESTDDGFGTETTSGSFAVAQNGGAPSPRDPDAPGVAPCSGR